MDHTEHSGHLHTDHEAHAHIHDVSRVTRKRLWIAFWINAAFLILEVTGGILFNSLALLADAGHMLTDVAALVLAIVVSHMTDVAPTAKRTYGLLRAEVLGAFINGAALVVIVGFILIEAWHRLGSDYVVEGWGMLAIASAGFVANLVSAWVLFDSRDQTLNVRGAFLHMAADALGSVGAITAGIVILLTGWTPVDIIASVIIGVLILWGSWGLLSQTANILLEATPPSIDYHDVYDSIREVPHIVGVHDLHIWTIGSGMFSLSAHVNLSPECSDSSHWQECLRETQIMIRDRFGIDHVTLQFEPEDYDPCDDITHEVIPDRETPAGESDGENVSK